MNVDLLWGIIQRAKNTPQKLHGPCRMTRDENDPVTMGAVDLLSY